MFAFSISNDSRRRPRRRRETFWRKLMRLRRRPWAMRLSRRFVSRLHVPRLVRDRLNPPSLRKSGIDKIVCRCAERRADCRCSCHAGARSVRPGHSWAAPLILVVAPSSRGNADCSARLNKHSQFGQSSCRDPAASCARAIERHCTASYVSSRSTNLFLVVRAAAVFGPAFRVVAAQAVLRRLGAESRGSESFSREAAPQQLAYRGGATRHARLETKGVEQSQLMSGEHELQPLATRIICHRRLPSGDESACNRQCWLVRKTQESSAVREPPSRLIRLGRRPAILNHGQLPLVLILSNGTTFGRDLSSIRVLSKERQMSSRNKLLRMPSRLYAS